jgi:hypothetical protein
MRERKEMESGTNQWEEVTKNEKETALVWSMLFYRQDESGEVRGNRLFLGYRRKVGL